MVAPEQWRNSSPRWRRSAMCSAATATCCDTLRQTFRRADHGFHHRSFGMSSARQHRPARHEARAPVQKILSCWNYLGLLSEDLDPITGELWGNFPQHFSAGPIILAAMPSGKLGAGEMNASATGGPDFASGARGADWVDHASPSSPRRGDRVRRRGRRRRRFIENWACRYFLQTNLASRTISDRLPVSDLVKNGRRSLAAARPHRRRQSRHRSLPLRLGGDGATPPRSCRRA